MKTFKEKWADALPAFLSVLCLLLIAVLMIWGMGKLFRVPTPQEQVEQIKLCQDNNLDTYMTELGEWRCKPKSYNKK
jgi:hypothetical protein